MKNKEQIIDSILNRGVIVNILPSKEEFKKLLLSEKKLRFYIGADTTGKSLHLSHAKNFMLLEEFRQLGHKVFVLFGDVTACIGDPSDRASARAKLTKEQAKENAASWVEQIRGIINFDDKENPAEVVFNSTWLEKLTITDTLELLSNATVQQMIERDMFQKRIAENKPIHLHEFLYPMFQGFDSVALDVDVEMCGTDQVFNALVGRDLLKKLRNKEKFIIANNLMENPKTGVLMSKSNNTGVFLGADAKTMFGQIMALPDEMIEILLINNTRVSLERIKTLEVENKPMEVKLFASKEVVKVFFGEKESLAAYDNFISTFSRKAFPVDAPLIKANQCKLQLLELVGLCMPSNSKSQNKRLIIEGAIKINGEKIADGEVEINGSEQVQIGKRGFFRLEI